jgi:hypothetical protein
MARRIAYQGAKSTIAFARRKTGECTACEFFDGLSLVDKAKLVALFRIAADHGKFHNPEKFGDLGNGLYEFKSFQIRMPFAYTKNPPGLILATMVSSRRKTRHRVKRSNELGESTTKIRNRPSWRS